jgi:cobalt/nickel transport system permease protein
MHMADALISPAVGGTMWAISGGLIAYCANKVKTSIRDNLVPMMGVLGAFIFAAQMINFSIPGTGSSGHLGGGLILTALLGPYAAFLVMASVLTVQAFFFADGGLLALGCNIFNLGFFPAFVAYPLLYKAIVNEHYGTSRAWVGAIIAAVVGLQLGAFSVVLETKASGISELPFGTFVLMMLPIHLAIGVVEGLATAAVISFVAKARPEALQAAPASGASVSLRPVLIGLAIAAVIMGGVASWFASTHPDGLEWSMAKVSGKEELERPGDGIHKSLAEVQERTAFLPDYGFKSGEAAPDTATPAEHAAAPEPEPWPAVNAGTSVAGIVGGLMTLALACLIGIALRARSIQRTCGNG